MTSLQVRQVIILNKYILLFTLLPLLVVTNSVYGKVDCGPEYQQIGDRCVNSNTPSIEVTLKAAQGGTTISMIGNVFSPISDITYIVISPNGMNTVALGQTSPQENGNFHDVINIDDSWTENGFYEFEIAQGGHMHRDNNIYLFVEVNNMLAEETDVTNIIYLGIPKFITELNDPHTLKLENQITKWEKLINSTQESIDSKTIKFDEAITNNKTNTAERHKETIQSLMAMNLIYESLISQLEQLLIVYS